jgi:ADP-ribose pyrophosphatase YjhB (NUDIX family)
MAPLAKASDTQYTCENNHHYWNNPRGAVAIVFIRRDEVLLSKRGIEPYKGKYDLPGGFIEFNEDPYDAAIREIEEETGVKLSRDNLRLISAYTNLYLPTVTALDLIFVAETWTGDFVATDDSEALEWKPFSFVETPEFSPEYKGLRQLLEIESIKM